MTFRKSVQLLILAGGKGTRMNSELPKVLNLVAGVPIITRLLQNTEVVDPDPVLVVGYRAAEVITETGGRYRYVHQEDQLGTAHAVQCAKECLGGEDAADTVVVLPGD